MRSPPNLRLASISSDSLFRRASVVFQFSAWFHLVSPIRRRFSVLNFATNCTYRPLLEPMISGVSAKAAPHLPQDVYVSGSSIDFPSSDCWGQVISAAASVSTSARRAVFPLAGTFPIMKGSKAEATANSSRQPHSILWCVLILN